MNKVIELHEEKNDVSFNRLKIAVPVLLRHCIYNRRQSTLTLAWSLASTLNKLVLYCLYIKLIYIRSTLTYFFIYILLTTPAVAKAYVMLVKLVLLILFVCLFVF